MWSKIQTFLLNYFNHTFTITMIVLENSFIILPGVIKKKKFC